MRSLFVLFSLFVLLSACKKDLSGEADILNYSISNVTRSGLTLDKVHIDKSGRTVSLLFADYIPIDSIPISFTADFSLSAGASSEPASGETVTLTNKDEGYLYTITAEDGSQVEYYIILRDNQLPNSGFEDWFTATGMNGNPYEEPGLSATTTVWATANYGTSIYGVYCTLPVIDGDNTVAQITTGETTIIPITAGTLFTGKFDIDGAIKNPTNPRKAAIFGIPFSLRPVAMKVKYKYQPGSRYVHATLNDPDNIFGGFTVADIDGEDTLTIYSTLEIRNADNITEIGRAEFYSGDLQDVLTEKILTFEYTTAEKPTHISVVFSSSKYGDLFTGAVGSTLIVDDVELIYEE